MGNDTQKAIEILGLVLAILAGIREAAEVVEYLRDVLARAQSEGRDVTPEEIAESKRRRDVALAALKVAVATS